MEEGLAPAHSRKAVNMPSRWSSNPWTSFVSVTSPIDRDLSSCDLRSKSLMSFAWGIGSHDGR